MPNKDLVFKIKADLLKSLSHPTRLAILDYLKVREASVGEMVSKLCIEQSGLSKHLSILKHAGILRSRQEKVTVYYSVCNKDIYIVLRTISAILIKRFKEGESVLRHMANT